MNCVICFENMKALNGGQETNWSQRCVGCKDSWVCGDCYHEWDNNHSDPSQGYQQMPCVICKEDMIYSNLVNRFNEGTGCGWWQDRAVSGEAWGPLWDLLDRNTEI